MTVFLDIFTKLNNLCEVSSRSNRNTKSSSIVESMQKGISENEKQPLYFMRLTFTIDYLIHH